MDNPTAPESWDQDFDGEAGEKDDINDATKGIHGLNVNAAPFIPGQNVYAKEFVPSFLPTNSEPQTQQGKVHLSVVDVSCIKGFIYLHKKTTVLCTIFSLLCYLFVTAGYCYLCISGIATKQSVFMPCLHNAVCRLYGTMLVWTCHMQLILVLYIGISSSILKLLVIVTHPRPFPTPTPKLQPPIVTHTPNQNKCTCNPIE